MLPVRNGSTGNRTTTTAAPITPSPTTPAPTTAATTTSPPAATVTVAGRTTRRNVPGPSPPTANNQRGNQAAAALAATNTRHQEHMERTDATLNRQFEYQDEQRLKRKADCLEILDVFAGKMREETVFVQEEKRRNDEEKRKKRRFDTQDILSQMFEMRQGNRPNLFPTPPSTLPDTSSTNNNASPPSPNNNTFPPSDNDNIE